MKLQSIWIETTTRCNLRCQTCGKSAPGQDMPLPLFQKIADQTFAQVEEVVLTGIGEPTVTAHFHEMCALTLQHYQKRLVMITNGLRLNKDEQLLELLVNDQVHLVISIDGLEETYEWIRRGAKWSTLTQVIKKINEKRQTPAKQFHWGINFVLNRYNSSQLLTLLQKAMFEWQANYLCVILMQPFAGSDHFFKEAAPVHFQQEVNNLLEEARKLADKHHFSLLLPAKFNLERKSQFGPPSSRKLSNYAKSVGHTLFWNYPQIYQNAYQLLQLPNSYCSVPKERLYFSVNGNIAPCCGLQDYILGSLEKNSLAEIMQSSRHATLLNHFDKRCLPIECWRCNLPFGITKGNPAAY